MGNHSDLGNSPEIPDQPKVDEPFSFGELAELAQAEQFLDSCSREQLEELKDALSGQTEVLKVLNSERGALFKRLKVADDGTVELYIPEPDEQFILAESGKAYAQDFLLADLPRLQQFASTIPPMTETTQLSICIPAAAFDERETIYQALSSFTTQTANPKSFEIVVFANNPITEAPNDRERAMGTILEVQRFQQEHPEMQTNLLVGECDRSFMTIGLVRKTLTDTVLLRALEKVQGDEDHIIVSCDADTCGVHRQFVENYINRFRDNPKTDAFSGMLDYDPRSYVNNPLVYVGSRVWMMLDAASRVYEKNILGPGANFAFRASSYAAVNGYIETPIAEDVNLRRKFIFLREGAEEFTPVQFAHASSRLFTSSRRSVRAVEAGYAPIEQWAIPETKFSETDEDIRVEAHRYIDCVDEQLSSPTFQQDLQNVINRTLAIKGCFGEKSNVPEAALERILTDRLGISFVRKGDNEVEITSIEGFLEHYREYQSKGLHNFARTTGLPPFT